MIDEVMGTSKGKGVRANAREFREGKFLASALD
jgi:hypothetical protein